FSIIHIGKLLFKITFVMLPPPPFIQLFAYTTLFRSCRCFSRGTLHRRSQFVHEKSETSASEGLVRMPRDQRTQSSRPDRVNSHRDRKSTRLNSSHVKIAYAVLCLKKKLLTLIERYEI